MWTLVVLALVFRVGYNLALHPEGHPARTFVIDEREYFGAAHMLAEGRGFSYYDTALWVRPPLYAALLGALFLPFGSGYLAPLLAQALLSALTLPALGWLAFLVGGRRAARCALVLGLLYLPFTLFSGLLLSETLFVFLFAWALVLLAKSKSLPEWSGRWSWRAAGVVAVSGVLLGLAVLTRSTALGFVPLAALWLAWGARRGAGRRIAYAGLMLVVALAALVPWVARNYAAYGRFVPVDTTGGYNLWLGSVGVRDEERLQADLRAISNPADRQSHAYSKALEQIASDPARFAAKGLKESLDLWLPSFGAEERQVRGYALGRVPAWHLASLFALDDLLYLAILLLAIAGLFLAAPHPLKGLTGLWVLLWVFAAFIFFAVTRFRLSIVAGLVPWAGVGAALVPGIWRRLAAGGRAARIAITGGLAAMTLVLLIVVPALPLADTLLGIGRWNEQAPYRAAEELLRTGRPSEAVEKFRQANVALSDTRYALAAALAQIGRSDEALTQLRTGEDPDRFEPYLVRGEIARRRGNLEEARSLFNARPVQLNAEEAQEWAWLHISPQPKNRLEIGSGLDLGYVRGFHAAEVGNGGRAFRWAGETAEVRGLQGTNGLKLTWNGWRPEGVDEGSVAIRWSRGSDGSSWHELSAALPVDEAWLDLQVSYPDMPEDAHFTSNIALKTNAFIGSGADPRLLGVQLSSVEMGR